MSGCDTNATTGLCFRRLAREMRDRAWEHLEAVDATTAVLLHVDNLRCQADALDAHCPNKSECSR